MAGLFNPAHIKELATSFLRRNDKINRLGNAVSHAQLITGGVALWPMSVFRRSPFLVYDVSGADRNLSTGAGTPTIAAYQDFLPYVVYGGVGYLVRLDEADLDITGTEANIITTRRGLTIMAWVWFDNAASAVESVVSKWNATGNQRSYRLIRAATGTITLQVSVDGTAAGLTAVNGSMAGSGQWYFVAGRLVPSTSMDVFVGQQSLVKTTNVAAIPASIFVSTADFTLGANATGGETVTGRGGMVHLAAAALTDAEINAFHQQTKVLAGF